MSDPTPPEGRKLSDTILPTAVSPIVPDAPRVDPPPMPKHLIPDQKVSRILITFPEPVDLPRGADRILSTVVDTICDSFNYNFPHKTMWAAGQGFMPIWKEGDIVDFDRGTYSIECSVQDVEPDSKKGQRRAGHAMAIHILRSRLGMRDGETIEEYVARKTAEHDYESRTK